MTIFINPYKRGSHGAKELKEALTGRGIKTILTERAPNFNTPLVVFWGGDTAYPLERFRRVVNHPSLLGPMKNKLAFFRRVGNSDMVPAWTERAAEAYNLGDKVVARQRLEASGGAGIAIWQAGDGAGDMPHAPLYVKYEKKTHEFRLHMARSLRGNVFNPLLIQRKVFKKSAENPEPKSWDVRNHDNGFVFVQNEPCPEAVVTLSRDFMAAHFPELHFAALDVIWHEPSKKGYVLEGNTAPGLEGNTIQVYANYLEQLHGEA